MSQDNTRGENVVYRTPPKMAFAMGAMVGITLASLTAFGLTFSMLNDEKSSTNNTNGTVAGAADELPTNTNTATVPEVTRVDIAVSADDHIRGSENAPVTLIEYSDFECPYCTRVQPTIEQLLEEYDGEIQHIFRHYPLSFHPQAQKAGEASECAADQGKFWEMHDKLFALNELGTLSVDNYKQAAKDLGLNTSQFDACLDNGDHATTITDGLAEGTGYGVKGTPATFVNGILVSGAQPIENFRAVIDSALVE
ncbi:MAG: thioredoxin domain-containing protein [Patescibacteria group bacterium]